MEESLRKLTEDEKQKVISVLNDFFSEYFHEEPCKSGYITEYDVLMKEKEEEFKLRFLEDNESSEIDIILKMCDEYLEEKENPQKKVFGAAFGLIMQYDMWLNECPFWPTNNPKLWKKWERLKKKKVKKEKNNNNGVRRSCT
jgi:hypothetical protein